MNDYYSTQTTLVDRLAKNRYGRYYVYVAEEFDPPKNDPTSNPRRVRDEWCRILAELTPFSAAGSIIWKDYKERLKEIFRVNSPDSALLDETGLAVLREIIEAKISDAAPIVYIIPRQNIVDSRLYPGDDKGDKFPDNVEYIIKDLQDADIFMKDSTPCG